MDTTLVCRDCGIPMKRNPEIDPPALLKKCDFCLERDQDYRERGRQEDMGDYEHDTA